MSEPQASPETRPPTEAPDAPDASASPYKNLFVPLVVVPALIVGAIVLVFVFFGAVTGSEASLPENLDRVMRGGAGDHTQAAFNMVRQIAENREAERKGEPPPWPVGSDFLPRLARAWETVPEDEPLIRLVLATLLAQFGEPEGVPSLIALLDLPPTADPEGQVRFHALANLGALGDPRALEPVRRILEESDDVGLRSVAAIALQNLPGEAAREALVGALDDSAFEVRANAALGLADRGDPSGARVLLLLLARETYEGENQRDPSKFAQGRRISEARVQAVEAVLKLRRAEDREPLVRLADEEQDLAVREAALRALQAWP